MKACSVCQMPYGAALADQGAHPPSLGYILVPPAQAYLRAPMRRLTAHPIRCSEWFSMIFPQTRCLWLELTNPRAESLRFENLVTARFIGQDLIVPSEGLIAKHADRRWVTPSGASYARLECLCDHVISFVDEACRSSARLGPFASFFIDDGVAYVDHRIVAFSDGQYRDWYSMDFRTHWRGFVLRAP